MVVRWWRPCACLRSASDAWSTSKTNQSAAIRRAPNQGSHGQASIVDRRSSDWSRCRRLWLNEAVNKAAKTDKVREALAKLGVDPGGGTPEAFGALVRSETELWTKVVKEAAIKINP